jgi:hypothetical protein
MDHPGPITMSDADEFDNFGDSDLAQLIYHCITFRDPVWDKQKIARAVNELDRRFNRS